MPDPTTPPQPAQTAAGEVELSIVDWLPPFRLSPRVLFEGELEVTHGPTAMLPFAQLKPEPETLRFRPHPHGQATILAAERSPEELRRMLAQLPAQDLSRPTRTQRWVLGTALAGAEATEALRQLGGLDRWRQAVAERRRWYLGALDKGSPPPADLVAEACRAVPHCLRGLGNALPTAEAVQLLAPYGRVCELGAGFGLVARAMERAGILVAASDLDSSARTGIGYPVRKGHDALTTIAFFEERDSTPPLLMVWPQFDESAWYTEVFARARSGQVVAMASPEFEFCAAGGLAVAAPEGSQEKAMAGPGWHAAAGLLAKLATDYEEIGQAPLVASGWPMVTTPLRLWRRR